MSTTPELIPTPQWLAELSRQQQAATPYFGLGFEPPKLLPGLHGKILDHASRNARLFRPAPSREEVRSLHQEMIPVVQLDDEAFIDEIHRELQPLHETWAGMKLERSAGGGLRAYQRGSYLLEHADRGSAQISSTLCIERDGPWPFRIRDVDGQAHDFDLAPAELMFYEGARLLHGRPWPLQGSSFLSLTLHYRPAGIA